MKSFKEFFLEGLSSILYHNTTTSNLVSILKDNTFQLSTDLGTDSDAMYDRSDDKPFFLSTSRIKYGGYARSISDNHLTCLVLNGRLLSQRFYGKPVDYWGSEYRPDTKSEYYLQNNENEDRLFSSSDHIQNASKYINEIHIMLHKSYLLMKYDFDNFDKLSISEQNTAIQFSTYYQDILALCQVYNIPVFFYKNKSDFIVQNKNKSEPIRSNSSKLILSYIELLTKDSEQQLSDDSKDILTKLKYYDKEQLTTLKNHIHNNRKNIIELKKIGLLTKEMTKKKIKGLQSLISFLKNKWN